MRRCYLSRGSRVALPSSLVPGELWRPPRSRGEARRKTTRTSELIGLLVTVCIAMNEKVEVVADVAENSSSWIGYIILLLKIWHLYTLYQIIENRL